ncbi:DivIVA domain-containing protein [Arundinibacter roseus]|uniref:DivIVA domain-containing protein n=1 Tax=Arundinibacter roseus TaxID=2070510 RepID=A0A4R4KET3_9BACT|nr:DivIVA domain-containing protein [Arundinibacter roseus]TDB65336.1 DivIVA domain-containing protein [Arundinibacter roseus]
MKISPIDIRQHTFEKGFRGYNIDEVNAFLNSLSQEWERVMNENKMLKMQLEIAEKELNKLRDVEMTLFRTLKTAEDTSSQITDQANKAAEKYLLESRQKSDEMLVETRRKAAMLVQDAENEAKFIKEEIINELKNQERDFKTMEKYRDNLIVQLKSLVNNTNETVERFEKKFNQESFGQRMEEIKLQILEAGKPQVPAEPVEKESGEEEAIVMSENDLEVPAAEEIVADIPVETSEMEAETEIELKAVEGAEIEVVAKNSEGDEDVETASEEAGNEEMTFGHSRVSDAASEAMAEIEKMAQNRKAAQELEQAKKGAQTEDDTKNKGSFFDQIG